MWRSYRFQTNALDDYRPLKFNPRFPWWCSGTGETFVVIIAYLPKEENLLDYWDDAYNIDYTEHDEITFTERFPKPDYFIN